MRVRIQVVESEAGDPPLVPEIATLERGSLQPDGLGLTLAEAKDLLRGVQETMVAEQVAAFELSVIRDPRIRGIVNDVVIENGNARYQDAVSYTHLTLPTN